MHKIVIHTPTLKSAERSCYSKYKLNYLKYCYIYPFMYNPKLNRFYILIAMTYSLKYLYAFYILVGIQNSE